MTTNGPLDEGNSSNPTYLPARYEIRRLGPEHVEWAKAIVMHSNLFHSPVWPVLYPEDRTKRLHKGMVAASYLVEHQIESGMSFGVFDTEYEYKRPESKATEGKLYWNENEDADGPELLKQMDFPLVSVALAYDQINPLNMNKLAPVIELLPLFGTFYHIVDVLDKRDPDTWVAKRPREMLLRNATSSRHDYEGAGIMKKLAQFLMREAKREGYRGIQIECLHDAVTKTWLNPPAPFRGELVSSIDLSTYEEKTEQGETIYPFRPCKQIAIAYRVEYTNKGSGSSPVSGYIGVLQYYSVEQEREKACKMHHACVGAMSNTSKIVSAL